MWPLIELTVEPESPGDHEKLVAVLARMAAENPCFRTSTDWESGQVVLHGWDEAGLDHTLAVLVGRGVRFRTGAPQVAYRETITRWVEIDYCHKKAYGPKGEFARVVLVFEPGESGSGFVFASSVCADAVPVEFVVGVATGLEANRAHGLLAGFPVIDMKATLVDGAWHDVDSSVLAFEIAARSAFNALRKDGEPILLEPVMAVKVSAPQVHLAAIIADLRGHRGAGAAQDGVVKGLVPLAGLLGYESRLRGLTEGLGAWSMVFDRYAPVPLAGPPEGVFPPAMGMRA